MGLLSDILPIAGAGAGALIAGPMGALVGGTVGGSVGGALASEQAAGQQSAAAQAAIAEQQRQFDINQANLAPYRASGTAALNQMMKLMGLGPLAVPAVQPTSGGMRAQGGGFNVTPGQALGAGLLFGPMAGTSLAPAALASSYRNASPAAQGGMLGGIVGGASGLFEGALSGLGLATGGDAHGGKTYVVGEEGPEILHMDPGSHGYVQPNPNTVVRAMEGRATGGPVGGGLVADPIGNINNYRTTLDNYMTSGQKPPIPPAASTQPVPAPQSVPTPFNPTAGNATPISTDLTPTQIMRMDPGYRFRMQQGIRALDMSAAASGGLLTGGHLKALEEFGQGYASQEFGNIYSRLAALAAGGQGAAVNSGYMGQGSANAIGGYLTNQGNAQAGGTMGSYNAVGQGLGNLAFLYGQGAFNPSGGTDNSPIPFMSPSGTNASTGINWQS